MTAVLHATHNQGDKAESPRRGWDFQCLTERSPHPPPRWAERHTSPRLKGLAIDWNPDVLTVHRRGARTAHPSVRGITPRRGGLWVAGELTEVKVPVALVCSHRINDHDGANGRPMPALRRVLWWVHDQSDRRLVRMLERQGYVVLYGGDVNDRDTRLRPLRRHLTGRYDALAHSRDRRVRVLWTRRTAGGLSDHDRFTTTYQISGATR